MFTFFVTLTLLVSCTAMPGHDGANGTCKNLNGSPMSPDASSHAGHGHHRQLHGGEGYKKIAHARSYGLVLLARTSPHTPRAPVGSAEFVFPTGSSDALIRMGVRGLVRSDRAAVHPSSTVGHHTFFDVFDLLNVARRLPSTG